MMYGEELHVCNPAFDDTAKATAVILEAAAGAILTKNMELPGMVVYWGFLCTVTFNYDTQTAEGVLSLYKETKSVLSATVAVGGTGYAVGDLVSVTQAGASGAILRVTAAPLGVVTALEVVAPGSNYSGATRATVALNGAGDNALTAVIVTKKLMSTMSLVEGYVAGYQYMKRVSNALGDDVSPTPRPPASFKAGEVVTIEISTQAVGGTEVGDFQPILVYQHRGENFAGQPQWVEVA